MTDVQGLLAARLDQLRQTRTLPAGNLSWQVRQLLACIETRLFDPALRVAALRKQCNLRDHNVSTRFKQEVGVPVKCYVLGIRLDAARALLEEGRFRIHDVALAVGFRYTHTFREAFKNRFGITPAAVNRGRIVALAPDAFRLGERERRTLEAAMERILPAGEGPGASQAGAIDYVDWLVAQRSFQSSLPGLTTGLRLLDTLAGGAFADRSEAERDVVLGRVQKVPHPTIQRFFVQLVSATLAGFLCDPRYGGNRGRVGWKSIGFEPVQSANNGPSPERRIP